MNEGELVLQSRLSSEKLGGSRKIRTQTLLKAARVLVKNAVLTRVFIRNTGKEEVTGKYATIPPSAFLVKVDDGVVRQANSRFVLRVCNRFINQFLRDSFIHSANLSAIDSCSDSRFYFRW